MEIFGQFSGLGFATLTALLCGAALMRFGQPPVAGYVLAGFILGPGALGVVHSQPQMGLLAEIGVALLLFVIGAQLSLRAFMATWKTAISAVALQAAVGLISMLACAWLFGLSLAFSVLLGFAAALSSAAMTVSMLHHLGASRGRVGRITTGIVIAQAFAILPILFLVEYLGSNSGAGAELIGKIVIAAALLAMLVKFLGRRKPLDLPVVKGVDASFDPAPLTALAYCLAAASAFGFLGLSAPFGAFMAGLVIGRSKQRKRMMAPFLPVRNILVLAFFLSIGLLTDLNFIAGNPAGVLFLVLMISLVKTATNVAALRILGRTWRDASVAGLSLSQLGEFSVILAGAALAAGAIGPQELKLVVAVTGLGLMASPLWLIAARRVHGMAGDENPSLDEISTTVFRGDLAALRRNFAHIRHGEFRAIADHLSVKRPPEAAPLPANDDEDPPAREDPEPGPYKTDTAETIAAIGAGVRAARFDASQNPRGERQ